MSRLALSYIYNPFDDSGGHAEMIEMLKRRHEIYCGLKNKDVALLPGNPPGATDCESFISVPLEDPQADLVHKHEWQHWFFQTDLRARAQFVEKYAERVLLGVTHRHRGPMRHPLEVFLHLFTNGLDDLRVNSLWKSIYPHSAEQIEERWKTIILNSGRFKTDVTFYMMGAGLGILPEMGQQKWSQWDRIFLENTEKVKGKSFPAVLISARVILDEILQSVLEGIPPPTEPQAGTQGAQQAPQVSGQRRALGQRVVRRRADPTQQARRQDAQEKRTGLLERMVDGALQAAPRGAPHFGGFMDTPKPPATPDPNRNNTNLVVSAALGVSTPEQIDRVLQMAQRDIDHMLATLRASNAPRPTLDQMLMRGLEGKARFHDITSEDVLPLELEPQDRVALERMKAEFSKLMDRRRRRLSDSGNVLDPQAYIDMLYGGDADIFIEDVFAKGFQALILLDMSGSMTSRWNTVARAAKTMSMALKAPFVKYDVWGFTSRSGHVDILRFLDTVKGFRGPGVDRVAWGLTPLHLATRVAIKKLEIERGAAQHLIILTDGIPTHIGNSGRASSSKDLIREVSEHVRIGRQRRVNVAGLVVGDQLPDGAADVMFGGRRFWSRVDDDGDGLYRALVSLVQTAFVHYLRGS